MFDRLHKRFWTEATDATTAVVEFLWLKKNLSPAQISPEYEDWVIMTWKVKS